MEITILELSLSYFGLQWKYIIIIHDLALPTIIPHQMKNRSACPNFLCGCES